MSCLRKLLSKQDEASDIDMEPVMSVMESKSGAKRHVANMILQHPFLNQRETALRQSLQAWTCYGKDVKAAEEMLEKGDAAELQPLVEKVGLWRKALRTGGVPFVSLAALMNAKEDPAC